MRGTDNQSDKARIGVVLPDANRRWLKLQAAKLDVSMSTLTSKIIQEYIDSQEAKTKSESVDEGP